MGLPTRMALGLLVLGATAVLSGCAHGVDSRTVEFDAVFTVHATDTAQADLVFDTSRRWMGAERRFLRFEVEGFLLYGASPPEAADYINRAVQSRTRAAFDAALNAICATPTTMPPSPLLGLDDAALVRAQLCVPIAPGSTTLVARPYCLTAQILGAPRIDTSSDAPPGVPPDLDGTFCGGPGTPLTVDVSALAAPLPARAAVSLTEPSDAVSFQFVVRNGGLAPAWFEAPALLESGPTGGAEFVATSRCPTDYRSPLAPGGTCAVDIALLRTLPTNAARVLTLVMRGHTAPAGDRRLVTDQQLFSSTTVSFDGDLATAVAACAPTTLPDGVVCPGGGPHTGAWRVSLGFGPIGRSGPADYFLAGSESAASVFYAGQCGMPSLCPEMVGVVPFVAGVPATATGAPIPIARPVLPLVPRSHEVYVLACGATGSPSSLGLTVLDGAGLGARTLSVSLPHCP